MNKVAVIHKSDRGSVRFLVDKFYDCDYNVVYIPLTENVAGAFVELVNIYEARVERKLNRKELDQCARLAEKSK